jgi:hypothetical protein
MEKTTKFNCISKLLAITIIGTILAAVFVFSLNIPPWAIAPCSREIRDYKEELIVYIDMIKNEITVKEAELANLDEKLRKLESRYSQLMEENERITKQINSLVQAANN